MTKTAEQMLSEEEVRAMIDACKTPKDRALIAMLYEGGFRIGEIASITWGQVKFTDWNVTINTAEKTGKPRFIPLVMARPYLAAWRNDYPKEIKDDALVFLTNIRFEPLQYAGLVKQMRAIAARAGVKKHITPHIFRHSRITHLIRLGMSESVIKLMMWGNITTKMFATYAHITGGDIENEIAELHGISRRGEKKSDALEPRQCPRCYTVNGPTHQFCCTCGLELTEDAKVEVSTVETVLEKDPRYALVSKLMNKLADHDPERIAQILNSL